MGWSRVGVGNNRIGGPYRRPVDNETSGDNHNQNNHNQNHDRIYLLEKLKVNNTSNACHIE
jgi:hypothetical protein